MWSIYKRYQSVLWALYCNASTVRFGGQNLLGWVALSYTPRTMPVLKLWRPKQTKYSLDQEKGLNLTSHPSSSYSLVSSGWEESQVDSSRKLPQTHSWAERN